MEISPLPPPHAPLTPSGPERPGVFERWFRRQKKPESTEPIVKPEARPDTPEKSEKPTRRLAGDVLKAFGLERPAEPKPARTEQPVPVPEQLQLEEAVDKTRRLGKATLRFVRGLLGREATSPPPAEQPETPAGALQSAETDLGEALGELNEATAHMPETGDAVRAEPTFTSAETSPPLTSLTARTAELQPLLETKESIANALAVAGLGVVAVGAAVLFAWEARRAAHERHRFEQEKRKDRRLYEAQEAQLREQEEALQHLKHVQTQAPEQPAYLRQVGEFTHRQATVTREVAREVREYTAAQPAQGAEVEPLPEVVIPVQRQSVETASSSVEAPLPVTRVEVADRIERTAGSLVTTPHNDQASSGAVGSAANGPVLADASPHTQPDPQRPPLSPAALQHQMIVKRQRAQFAWLAGIGLIVALLATAAVYIIF